MCVVDQAAACGARRGARAPDGRAWSAVARRPHPRRHGPAQPREHLLHERCAAMPVAYGHHRRVLCAGPVQGGPRPTQPIKLAQARHARGAHGAAGLAA